MPGISDGPGIPQNQPLRPPARSPLTRSQNQPLRPPARSPLTRSQKPAIAPSGSASPERGSSGAFRRGRQSGCEPWRDVISAKCELGLSAQRIYQDLVAEHNFTGNYYNVRRFVRQLVPTSELPFRRLECRAGDEAQVDFGTGARIVGSDGKRRKTHLFRIVLSHSRKAYSEVVHRQTTDEFLRCLENAFRHFGGAPRRLITDNLRAVVKVADWFDPEINPKVRSFGDHYGAVFLPSRPYTPRHKGKVENSIGYAQDNALKGRVFSSLEAQNSFLLEWELTVADKRIHGTTRRQIGKHFAEVERQALLPLPLEPFPSFREERRIVHRDGHVEVKRAYYAVPPEYLARQVWVRWDARLVRIFNERMQQIAAHVRKEPGCFSTPPEYIAAEKVSAVEHGAAALLKRVAIRLGPKSATWAEAMIQARGIEGTRVLLGLLSLANRHSVWAVENACEIALTYAAFHLRSIRALVKRQGPKQEMLPLLSDHPLIRPLSEYSRFVHDAFQFRNIHQ